jgi:hypothetical protein
LDKCPDKNASLKFTVELLLVREVDLDTISQISTASKLNDSFEVEESKPIENSNSDDPAQLRV